MAADGGRSQASHSAQVCVICKARKKKCDKVLPRCGYCVRRKGLKCGYETRPRNNAVPALGNTRSATFPLLSSYRIPSEPGGFDEKLYHHVHQLIRETGQFVDDITARYFQGFHRYLPVISRTRFHRDLITSGNTPSSGFSVLLLSISLVTSSPKLVRRSASATIPRPTGTQPLYLATKSLFAQVQGLFSTSVSLIQAGILLAVYEYAHGQPDDAFITITGCARMGYAARMHTCNSRSNIHPDTDAQLQAEEIANTWWGIIICERSFFCDVTIKDQPLITIIQNGDVNLPTEAVMLDRGDFQSAESELTLPVSCLSNVDVGAFGRAAQAAWLLGQVLKVSKTPVHDTDFAPLRSLDTDLQRFLGAVVQQCNGERGIFCEAIAIAIKALFVLHWYILSQLPQTKFQSLDEWYQCSYAALDTATKMVLDIVKAHENPEPSMFASIAPSYSYIVRAGLMHPYGQRPLEQNTRLWSTEVRLRKYLDRFNQQSVMSGY